MRKCSICRGSGRFVDEDNGDDFGESECPICFGDGRICTVCKRPESKCICDDEDDEDDEDITLEMRVEQLKKLSNYFSDEE